jgi:hypothetical protein
MQSPKRVRADSQLTTGRREWIASREAVRLVTDAYALHDIVEYESREMQQRAAMGTAVSAIMRRLTEGTLLARPIWFRFVQGKSEDDAEYIFHLHDEDRTIDPNFWRTLARLQSAANLARSKSVANFDWIAGDFSFDDLEAGIYAKGHACGVKFDRSALPALDLPAPKPSMKAGGAPRKWDWDGALVHLAALAHGSPDGLFRDDGRDPNQSDIARHLRAWFVDACDDSPESSQLRDYGKRFVTELNAVKLQAANNVTLLE